MEAQDCCEDVVLWSGPVGAWDSYNTTMEKWSLFLIILSLLLVLERSLLNLGVASEPGIVSDDTFDSIGQ